MTLSQSKREELRAKAEKATPGEWEAGHHPAVPLAWKIVKPVTFGRYVRALPEHEGGHAMIRAEDADYIAAISPAKFLSLTQALRESMEREAGLLSRAGDLLEQIDTLEGVEFSRDFEPYEAEACWDDAVSRLRAALSAPGSEAVK